MAGGRGPAPCGRDGCGDAGTGLGAGSAAEIGVGIGAGRPWLPQARWLARRLAALLVLLALVAAGCVLHRRACPPPRRRPPPGPGPAAPPDALRELGGPAAEQGAGLELPPLPRYEEVKHLPSYEEAQRAGDGQGDGGGWG